jgi:sugar phosphate isomerase/epimerase
MKRREFMGGSAAALAARRATDARTPTLVPCINQVTTLGAAFDAECAAYRDAGFRHVELWFPKLQGLGLAPPAIAARLRDAALTPVSACAAGNLLWRGAPGPGERRGELESHFALAQALGVPRFVIFDYVEAIPKRDDHAEAAARLVSLADLAAKYRVRIALEFIARSRLLGSLTTALQVIRQAAHPNVGLCLDTFHLYAGVSKLEDMDDLRPGEVEHVHFHDVPRSVPRELLVDADRIPPGTGVIPLGRVVDALRRIGYAGALSVELFDPLVQKSDPAATARACYAAVTRFTSPTVISLP